MINKINPNNFDTPTFTQNEEVLVNSFMPSTFINMTMDNYCSNESEDIEINCSQIDQQQYLHYHLTTKGYESTEELSEYNEANIVEFESSYSSLSDYFVKSTPQQSLSPIKQCNGNQPQQRKTKKLIKKSKRASEKPCCNCKNSQCLQRYCPCFHNDKFCSNNCRCESCNNNSKNLEKVERARMYVFKNCHRVKQQPREKLLETSVSYGCKCTKSQCSQGYCECFKRGQGCDDRCNCLDCKNIKGKKVTALNANI